MQKRKALLPLGSIVTLQGNPHKLMVVQRLPLFQAEDEPHYCDYSLCLYPEGSLEDVAIYSNHENIDKIVFTAYSDSENDSWIEEMYSQVEQLSFTRANPEPLSTW